MADTPGGQSRNQSRPTARSIKTLRPMQSDAGEPPVREPAHISQDVSDKAIQSRTNSYIWHIPMPRDYIRSTFVAFLLPANVFSRMKPSRFVPPTEVPGLAARRIAADILDGVLHRHRMLDDQLDGPGAHPGLKTLADRDRALMRRLLQRFCGGSARSATSCRGCSIAGFRATRRAHRVHC